MDGFERRRQEKKEAILNAALELFKKYGVNKVSIVDIASKASVSQVSIYNFFNSKENLKNELLKKLWENYYTAITSIIGSNIPIQCKIEKFFYTVVEYSGNYSANFIAESFRNQLQKEQNSTELQTKSIEEEIVSLLNQGIEEGVIKNKVSVHAMISYIEMFRYYVINNPEAALEYDRNPELLKEMITLYLNALFN
jgi:AcrR family transcriptional regulator